MDNEMTLNELYAEKKKVETQLFTLKGKLKEIAQAINLKNTEAEFEAMPDAKKESLRQIIGR
jgi:hypothetical protein